MKRSSIIWSIFFLTVPGVLFILFDPASFLSFRSLLETIFWTLFFIDLPVGMCLLHYHFPGLFHHTKKGHYSLLPWGIFFLLSWGIAALGMFLETKLGNYPENGFSAACAYLFGWAYIWITMIPIGFLYLLFRGIRKLWKKYLDPERKGNLQ